MMQIIKAIQGVICPLPKILAVTEIIYAQLTAEFHSWLISKSTYIINEINKL